MRPVLMNVVHGVAGPGQTVLPSARAIGVDYVVGPAALTERDVIGATAFDRPGQGWVVHFELSSAGTRKLNRPREAALLEHPTAELGRDRGRRRGAVRTGVHPAELRGWSGRDVRGGGDRPTGTRHGGVASALSALDQGDRWWR